MRNTSSIGDVSVAKITAALLNKQISVWMPWGGSSRADLLIEDREGIHKVQCKTGRAKNGSILFRTCSVHKKPGGGYAHRCYSGDVAYFGVYCPENNECYLVPIDKAGKQCCTLRLTRPRSSADKALWASEFKL